MNERHDEADQWQEEHSAELAKAQASAQHRDISRPWFEGWQPDERINEEDQSYWLLTMVDLMTLLLVLFVLLAAYAYQQKPAQPTWVDSVFEQEFPPQADPATELQSPTGALSGHLYSGALVLPTPPTTEPEPAYEPEPEERPASARSPLAGISERFADLGDNVDVTTIAGRINLRVGEEILFPSAEAELTESGVAVIEQVAARLERESYPIIVQGHTDNRPIQTARFPSNWELSAARASAVVRALVDAGIEPWRLSAVGYADTMPVADNFSAEGRAENRRVDIILDIPAN
ncbi:MAG TPA: flagellar motor protein MotB [Halothiobacillaceae bacterium]|nr:flagellar motor protein MotB [Halothiobacillaceae bacterium]